MLNDAANLSVTARSKWYATPAWPEGAGPDFVNAVIAVEGIGGAALLALLHDVETALGRTRKTGRWDARACDLDLLATGDMVLPDAERWRAIAAGPAEATRPGPVLPHPLMQTRAFVLVPMADVAGDWRHPLLGQTVAQMIAALPAEDVASVRHLPR